MFAGGHEAREVGAGGAGRSDGRVADEQWRAPARGELLQSVGDVDGVADDGKLEALATADVTQGNHPVMQADADRHRRNTGTGALTVPRSQCIEHAGGTFERTARIVGS